MTPGTAAGTLSPGGSTSRRRELLRTVVYHAAVGALGFVMLYPILWLFASSFKGPSEIWGDVISLVPRRFSLQNYVTGWAGFGGVTFATFYKNSLIYAGVGTVTAVLSSAVVAYGFARIRFAGRGFWFTCMLLTLMLPYQVIIIPQYVFFTKLNLVNTL